MIYYYIDRPDTPVIVSPNVMRNNTVYDLFQSEEENLFLVQIKNIDIIKYLETHNFYRVYDPKYFFNPT